MSLWEVEIGGFKTNKTLQPRSGLHIYIHIFLTPSSLQTHVSEKYTQPELPESV
jgi:hypothetical protein